MSKSKFLIPNKGFAPVLVLILLSVSLASAIYIATLFMNDKTSSPTPDNSVATEQSTNAFQAANSGSEAVLKKIYKEDNTADLTALAEAVSSTSECTEGVISGSTSVGSYKVSLYNGQGEQIKNCNDSTWRGQVAQIKSDGTSGDTSRGINVAVAAEPTPGITGGCTIKSADNNRDQAYYPSVISTWGVGCKSVLTDFADPANSDSARCSSTFLAEGTHGLNPSIGGGPIPNKSIERKSVAAPGYSCGQVSLTIEGASQIHCVCVKN